MSDEATKRAIQASVYENGGRYGAIIHWADGRVVADSGPRFKTFEDAEAHSETIRSLKLERPRTNRLYRLKNREKS